MKKLLSTNYSATAFNIALLLIRIVFGVYTMMSGYEKMVHYTELKSQFLNFLGMGMSFSLILAIFAEFFCGLFVLIGLFTRLATIPILILFSVAIYKVHHLSLLTDAKNATLYFCAFLLILLVGPGKASVDGFSGK
jgi:putative oxidoreductase